MIILQVYDGVPPENVACVSMVWPASITLPCIGGLPFGYSNIEGTVSAGLTVTVLEALQITFGVEAESTLTKE